MVDGEEIRELVRQLRDRSGKYDEEDWHSDIELKAADMIEELMSEVEDLTIRVERRTYADAAYGLEREIKIERLEKALRDIDNQMRNLAELERLKDTQTP